MNTVADLQARLKDVREEYFDELVRHAEERDLIRREQRQELIYEHEASIIELEHQLGVAHAAHFINNAQFVIDEFIGSFTYVLLTNV